MSYDWFTLDDGRSVYRKIEQQPRGKRSSLPMPMIRLDSTDPLRSMADGKLYTSRAAMRASYKASGNPQGVDYVEVGDDRSFVTPAPKKLARPDKKAIREAVERGKADISSGKYDHIT